MEGEVWEGRAQAKRRACLRVPGEQEGRMLRGWTPKNRGAVLELPTLEKRAAARTHEPSFGDKGVDPKSKRSGRGRAG